MSPPSSSAPLVVFRPLSRVFAPGRLTRVGRYPIRSFIHPTLAILALLCAPHRRGRLLASPSAACAQFKFSLDVGASVRFPASIPPFAPTCKLLSQKGLKGYYMKKYTCCVFDVNSDHFYGNFY